MNMNNNTRTIFPTELAKRRHERQTVLETGVLDTSRLFTMKKLMDLCERAARRAGLLSHRTPKPAELRLLLDEAVTSVAFAKTQPLANLSPTALAGVLSQLIEAFAFLAENQETIIEWLLAHEKSHKLYGLGQLLETWRELCTAKEIADRFVVNTALLQLIEHGELPHELKGEIHFRAVRWFNPFEERLVAALQKRQSQLSIFSVLPDAHAEAAEDRLCARVRSELERGNEEEWKPWVEDFADAFEADDSNILEDKSAEKISFFVSANTYGEIEDVARRIAKKIERGTAPDTIALILRDLSPYTDIIPDVFQRFNIPYYFRRGTPAAAHPQVKTLLAMLAFPRNMSRDRLCDLLLMPGIDWPNVDDRETLAQEIRDQEPPTLPHLPKKLSELFQGSEFSDQIQFIIHHHKLNIPEEVLELIQEIAAVESSSKQKNSLFEELLDNITLKDKHSTENGVWIINPMDASGLRFDTVYLAGMDDRTFPKIPKADTLLNADNRTHLRAFLREHKIECPRLALSETSEALIQEEILFLTTISAAKENLALSYTRTDADGKDRAPGEFFERMIGLTGCNPTLGESFHTILPPNAVRAADEARQTQAQLNPTPPTIQQPNISPAAIQKWIKNNPEFSATSLESLARNRYTFFLEKILGIKPDRTHEDTTDPMDRGTIIHNILELAYKTIAEQSDLYAKKTSEGWKLSQEGDIPLAVFNPSKTDELLALARHIAENEFSKAEQLSTRHLGHRAVWETEKRKLHQIIENYIRMDLETAPEENRYPALFEMKFEEKHNLPITLTHGIENVRLKGKVDRIDLIFETDGNLKSLLVIDYKGKSRNDTKETLEKKITHNLDCQLTLYTFAAQQKFFGAHNTPDLNENVQAVYHLQERELKKMTNHFSKKRLTMNQDLTEKFLETLFTNLKKLTNGDLATDPLIAGFEDYAHICRTTAIDPKDLFQTS